jgi:hypothetical protein
MPTCNAKCVGASVRTSTRPAGFTFTIAHGSRSRLGVCPAGRSSADVAMETPGKCAAGALHAEVDGMPATPSLRSPFVSPLRRTGVRGAPQRIATPAAERRVSAL